MTTVRYATELQQSCSSTITLLYLTVSNKAGAGPIVR